MFIYFRERKGERERNANQLPPIGTPAGNQACSLDARDGPLTGPNHLARPETPLLITNPEEHQQKRIRQIGISDSHFPTRGFFTAIVDNTGRWVKAASTHRSQTQSDRTLTHLATSEFELDIKESVHNCVRIISGLTTSNCKDFLLKWDAFWWLHVIQLVTPQCTLLP